MLELALSITIGDLLIVIALVVIIFCLRRLTTVYVAMTAAATQQNQITLDHHFIKLTGDLEYHLGMLDDKLGFILQELEQARKQRVRYQNL